MYIKNIALVNIGAYEGYSTFKFETKPNQNVLFISGENGAGKTTLLSAIKLGLFGAYSLGYKTDNKDYFKKIEQILHHKAQLDDANCYSITIQFTMTEHYKEHHYELHREWKRSANTIVEQVSLKENDVCLGEAQFDLFQSKLREMMPPQLLDCCFIDGEEIAHIITHNQLPHYIERLTKTVFHLNLFETLESDLTTYIKQQAQLPKKDTITQQLLHITQTEQHLRTQLATVKADLLHTTQTLTQITEAYHNMTATFEKHGGLHKQQREAIIQQITTIDMQRKQRAEEIKHFVAELLPFFLLGDLVNDTYHQLQKEQDTLLAKQVEDKLSDEAMLTLLKALNLPPSQQQGITLKAKLLHQIQPDDAVTIIQNYAWTEVAKVEHIHTLIQKPLPEHFAALFKQNQVELTTLQQLKEQLNTHDKTNEFSELIKQMDSYHTKMLTLQQQMAAQETSYDELQHELSNVLHNKTKITAQLHQTHKATGSLAEAQKIITVSQHYREAQLKKHIQAIQQQATKNITLLFRKADYITSLTINPETFDITLRDAKQQVLDKEMLSAGEKQMLLLAIIWAIFSCSGRQVPFVFDTLLSRLDQTHKAILLQHFIPYMGKQTILLATDSEMNEADYALLQPHIAQHYTLHFMVAEQRTTITTRQQMNTYNEVLT